jgi:hypothetical protein
MPTDKSVGISFYAERRTLNAKRRKQVGQH